MGQLGGKPKHAPRSRSSIPILHDEGDNFLDNLLIELAVADNASCIVANNIRHHQLPLIALRQQIDAGTGGRLLIITEAAIHCICFIRCCGCILRR